MLQFVMQDLLEREDIERIRKVVQNETQNSVSRGGSTILAVRRQLDKLAEDEKKKRATRDAKKAAAKAKGEVYKDGSEDDSLTDEEQDDAVEENLEQEDETQLEANRLKSGGQFGKEFNFKPFLSSLDGGESWEKAKKKAKCGYCGKQPWKPWITSCGHLICEEPCRTDFDIEAAENNSPFAPCKVCGITPSAIHPCEVDDEDPLEAVAHGTRSRSKKKKEKERKRLAREDINSDWLGSLGDDVLPSAKTIAVKSQIMNWLKENPHVKIIVYTQFLAM
jgi:predicted  nucleic acid-binding Zn-ribbon protein